MLDEDTIEVALVPGVMPGTETTQELPLTEAVTIPAMPVLSPSLAADPILTMPPPHETHPSLFEHYYGNRPAFYPPRPHKPPRTVHPHRHSNQVLSALGGGVVLLGAATYVMVQSGWHSQLPQSEQQRLKPEHTVQAPVSPAPRVPATAAPRHSRVPVIPRTSPAHIPSPSPSATVTEAPTSPVTPSVPTKAPSASPGPSQTQTSPVPSHSPSQGPSGSPSPQPDPDPSTSPSMSPSVSMSPDHTPGTGDHFMAVHEVIKLLPTL